MEKKAAAIRRIRIIQGQLDGIIKLIESEEPDCENVMNQMKAIKNAFQSLGGEVAKNFLAKCVSKEKGINEKEMEKVLSLFSKF